MRLSSAGGQLPAIPMKASESSSIWPILLRRTEGKMSHLNFMRFSGSSRPLVPQDTKLNAGFGLLDHVFSFHCIVAKKKAHQPFLRVLKFGNTLPVQRRQSWAQGQFFQEGPRPSEYRACRSLPEGRWTPAETEPFREASVPELRNRQGMDVHFALAVRSSESVTKPIHPMPTVPTSLQ